MSEAGGEHAAAPPAEHKTEHKSSTEASDAWLATKRVGGGLIRGIFGVVASRWGANKIIEDVYAKAGAPLFIDGVKNLITNIPIVQQQPAIMQALGSVFSDPTVRALAGPAVGTAAILLGSAVQAKGVQGSWRLPYWLGTGLTIAGSFLSPPLVGVGIGISVGASILSRMFPKAK